MLYVHVVLMQMLLTLTRLKLCWHYCFVAAGCGDGDWLCRTFGDRRVDTILQRRLFSRLQVDSIARQSCLRAPPPTRYTCCKLEQASNVCLRKAGCCCCCCVCRYVSSATIAFRCQSPRLSPLSLSVQVSQRSVPLSVSLPVCLCLPVSPFPSTRDRSTWLLLRLSLNDARLD